MERKEVCGTCKYNRGEWNSKKGYKDWYCNNEDSDCYGISTVYSDACKDWEERR